MQSSLILLAAAFQIIGTCYMMWMGYISASSGQGGKATIDFIVTALLLGSGAICYWFVHKGLTAVPQAVAPTSATQYKKRVFFFSPGVAVSLNRSGGTVFINLHILSVARTELIFVRLVLSDSTGLRITCEHSEPIVVETFDVTAKTFEQKITPQEMEKFQNGMMVNVDGYAKFRDGDKITTEQIHMSTIPSV